MSSIRVSGNTSGYYDLTVPDVAGTNTIPLNQVVTTDASGNLGIGTNSPSATLHVAGINTLFDSDTYGILELRVDNNDDQTNNDGIIKITTGSASLTKAELRYDESEDLVHLSYGDHGRNISISSTGNVGIGTGSTTPNYKLDITGPGTSNGVTLRLNDASSSADSRHILFSRGSSEASIGVAGSQANDPFWISRSGGYDLMVNYNGYVTMPTQPHISGSPFGVASDSGNADNFATYRSRGTLSFSNSRVTVPVDGVYLIVFQTIRSRQSGRTDSQIKINGVTYCSSLTAYNADDYGSQTNVASVYLSANDYIQFANDDWYSNHNGTTHDNWQTASVTLLS